MKNDSRDRTVVPIDDRQDELVERLLQLADAGPEIPAHGAEAVKAAVRPLWRKQVRHTGRRMAIGALAASTILALVLAHQMTRNQQFIGPAAVFEAVVAEVELEEERGVFRTVGGDGIGQALDSGAWISTGGGALASLRLADGHILRVDANTRLGLNSARRLILDRGAIYISSEAGIDGSLEIITPIGRARNIGTRFEVRAEDDKMRVAVREGVVEVDRDAVKIRVPVGRALTVHGDGTTEVRTLGPDDSLWDWAMAAAPLFEIENQSVMAFLDWVGRETGLRIQYGDGETAALASSTLLHGSIAGLSPRDAPEVVLPSTGLRSRVHQGTLTVSRATN